jgi:hypothetical protein
MSLENLQVLTLEIYKRIARLQRKKTKKIKKSLLRDKHSVKPRKQLEERLKRKHNFHPKKN